MTRPTSLAETFSEILKESSKKPVTVDRLLRLLSGRGYPFILLLLSLPFCQPLMIPGFSTPFGIVIFFIGLRMSLNHRYWWMPRWIGKKTIPHESLEKIVEKGGWLHQKLKRFIHPRLTWLSTNYAMRVFNGLLLALLGLFLALPLPIPLSNMVAGWSIFLISLGLIEDDGAFIIAGYVMTAAALMMLAVILLFFKWLIV